MTTKEIELDVDFIGGQNSLTAAEEKSITEFLNRHKISPKQVPSPKGAKHSKKTKATV